MGGLCQDNRGRLYVIKVRQTAVHLSDPAVDPGPPVQKAFVHEMPPQRDMVVVQRLQQLVDLRLGVVPVWFEASCDVLENHAPLS
jgi:hypothetical protein